MRSHLRVIPRMVFYARQFRAPHAGIEAQRCPVCSSGSAREYGAQYLAPLHWNTRVDEW